MHSCNEIDKQHNQKFLRTEFKRVPGSVRIEQSLRSLVSSNTGWKRSGTGEPRAKIFYPTLTQYFWDHVESDEVLSHQMYLALASAMSSDFLKRDVFVTNSWQSFSTSWESQETCRRNEYQALSIGPGIHWKPWYKLCGDSWTMPFSQIRHATEKYSECE